MIIREIKKIIILYKLLYVYLFTNTSNFIACGKIKLEYLNNAYQSYVQQKIIIKNSISLLFIKLNETYNE